MQNELQPLLSAVQHNCNIADAQHAGDYTLCVYLLKMREYYRWEQGLGYSDSLSQDRVGEWIRDREDYWESIENESYGSLTIDGVSYDPFENDAINAALNPKGLVYSGGLGRYSAPHFFLGRLIGTQTGGNQTVFESEEEYARELTAPPAMTRGRTTFIRRASVRRMVWEKIDEWRWKRWDNAMGRAITHLDFNNEPDAALEIMTDFAAGILRLHEQGEVVAGDYLGEEWSTLIVECQRSTAELQLRALRDNLADCLVTLPALVKTNDSAMFHFFFATLTPMRREIFPALDGAYQHWLESGSTKEIESLAQHGANHWSALGQCIHNQWNTDSLKESAQVSQMIESARL